jgi:hypothetical protein
MLASAVQVAAAGHRVLLVAATHAEAQRLERQARACLAELIPDASSRHIQGVALMASAEPLRGQAADVFTDHMAIEVYAATLEAQAEGLRKLEAQLAERDARIAFLEGYIQAKGFTPETPPT